MDVNMKRKFSYHLKTRVRTTSRRVGFTLIELLVVISIIALLLSILMPALQLAKDQAKTLLCQTKTRDMALAFQVYSNEHRYLPHAYGYDYSGAGTGATTGGGGIYTLNTPVVLQLEKYGIDPMTGYLCPSNKIGNRRWWNSQTQGPPTPHADWADGPNGHFYADVYGFYAYLDGQDLPPNTRAYNPEGVFDPVATHNRMSSRHALISDRVMRAYDMQKTWCSHWDSGRRKGFSTAYGDAHIEWSTMEQSFYDDPTTCQYQVWNYIWLYWWK